VGLIYVDSDGILWYYHSARQSGGITRRNLANKTEMQNLLASFPDNKESKMRILLVDIGLVD
jgi:hypothetical protein